MKKIIRNTFKVIITILSITILFIFFNKVEIVQAASENDVTSNISKINDGIYNWKYESSNYSPKNQVGEIPIGGGNYLDYTFGSARNSGNKVVNGGDNTITQDSTAGTGYLYNSKINVFLNQKGNYYGILHQPADSYIGNGGFPGRTSDTSLDFAYVNGNSSLSASNYGILTKLQNKVFYYGTDTNNNPVYKIGGFIQNQGLYAEILLRPSLSGAPIVQRELYLYNPTTGSKKTKFQIYFGEDTSIDATGSPAVDDVPLYALGNDEGLYLFSAKDPTTSDAKLFVTNNVPDGFSAYMGKVYSNSIDWLTKGKADIVNGGAITSPTLKFSGGLVTEDNTTNGDNGRKAGSNLLYGIRNGITYPVVDEDHKQNSAYTLRWPLKEMDPGETLHFASTMGATLAGYSIPQVKKTYTNLTPHSDGLNHVGDKLRFTLTVQNDGLRSSWNFKRIQDAMPTGLTIDPDSASYKWTEMTTSGTGNNQADSEVTKGADTISNSYLSNNKLDFTPNTNLKEKGKYYITFDATINGQASGTLTNTADFNGENITQSDTDKDYKASVDIPVATSNFKYNFTNQLRNISDNANSDFASTASGKAGDIIEYKSVFTSTASDVLKTGTYVNSVIKDNPNNLELVSGSVRVNNVLQPDAIGSGLDIKGSSSTVTFQAKIIGKTKTTISNTAVINKVTTSSGGSYNTLVSTEPAVLNITEENPTTSIVKVPSLINFGSTNSTGLDKTLLNTETKGDLIIDHSNDSKFQVSVSYDNEGAGSMNNGNNKLVQDDGIVLLFNQASSGNGNKWVPLSTAATPIKSDGFDGVYKDSPFTQYVNLNKWKLRVPGTAEPGRYTGTVTWSIQDSTL